VAREIDRGQRIIEGQNFEIRRTLWLYSEAVEKQRRVVSDRRQWLLHQESKPRETTLFHLDRHWAEQLARIDDIREGIHLQRYGGRIPVEEFQRQIFEAFGTMMRSVDRDVAESLRRFAGGGKNHERARPRGPATTWTYLVNDNPFSDFGFSLIAGRNIGFSAVAGLAAVQHLPITLILLLSRLFRRKKSK
jgi:preprotein translocase subunit SecA